MKIPFWPEFKGFRDIDLNLDRMHQALARLGNPHKNLPPTIHIAGTNGKGSTLAFLRSIFEENGYSVHAYSSPHLVNFNERIAINGKEISDKLLNECLGVCKSACEQDPKIDLTFFEGTTLAAFLAFAKVKSDILILETGMGGRLDATNVLDEVLASIITPISIDHSEFLGNSIQDIAREKAGIIKENSIVICSKQDQESLQVIKNAASEKFCQMLNLEESYQISKTESEVVFTWGFENVNRFNNHLDAQEKAISFGLPKYLNQGHQIENLSNVIALLLLQKKFSLNYEKVNKGITNAKWPARLERIETGKMYEKLSSEFNSQDFEIIVDGGHNPSAASAINNFLNCSDQRYNIVIFSILPDKDYQRYIDKIKSNVDLMIACNIDNMLNSRPVKDICNYCDQIGIKNIKSDSLKNSITNAIKFVQENNVVNFRVLIFGSLYLAGNFKEINHQ